MLRAVHGNRVESLLAALLDALPPADPFAPSTIVVGSHLVARWLTQRLALDRGIASGLELPTFDRFVERTWAGDDAAKAAGLTRLDRSELAAAIASVLAEPAVIRGLPAVAAYLDAAPAAGDRAGPRRVQLAEHLAGLYWNYALSRPDWMPAFVTGHVPAELAGDPTAQWQAGLLGAALRHLDPARQWAPTPLLPWLRRRAGLPAPRVRPVAVFGMSFLARAQLEALTDLASASDVTVYILDPCEELWDDVAGRQTTSIDPLPLVLWGRPVRDTLAALVERTGGDLDGRFAAPPPATAREQLLADVRTRSTPAGAAGGDAGVTVLACPNPRREIEVIAGEARRRLDADPTLCAHEIGVWIAGDHERYLAQAPAAFEAVGVPCHLVDAPIDDRGRIGEAMAALLALPTSGMARRDLLRVMTHPAVLARYPHVDAADWVRWTERLGIVHGADGAAHAQTYLAEHPGHFHWDQGVRRLALGAFMVGERAQRGAAKIASFEVAPEELRPDQQASAATYALVVRSLCSDAGWLATLDAPLTTWADVFAGLVDEYLAARDDDAKRDLERVRAMLAGLARLDLDGRAIGYREAREHAMRLLEAARANRGEPLAAGVMVAPLAAMRAVPFRVVFVAGLDEGAFPAGDQPSPLDLRREHRLGDVSPRDRDRAAFLDVMLGAREALYLSYVAVEPKSGQALGPSSVILELADALAPYVGAGSSREALATITVRQPLHRFGDAAPAVLPAVEQERWGCATRDALRAHLRAHGQPIPDEDGLFTLLAHPAQAELRAALAIVDAPPRAPAGASRSLNLTAVRGFLEFPLQAWAQAVLDLDELPDDATLEHSDEPFALGASDRVMLLRNVFALQLRDPAGSVEDRYDAEVKQLRLRGQHPVGVFAEASRVRDLDVLHRWRAALGPVPVGGVTRLGFGRSSAPGAELVPALELELAPGRVIRLVGQTELLVHGERLTSIIPVARRLEKKSKYHLRGAIDHLVLAAAGRAPAGHAHKLIDFEGAVVEVHHAPWSPAEARGFLAGLVTELLDQPHGYLLPFDAAVRALANARPSVRSSGDPRGVLGYGPIDRRDSLDVPPDARALALRRLGPLLERFQGDHGFEVVR